MNLGKRIEKTLGDLRLERKDLLARVPDLTPQALSNLICRDSKRSEWDEAIAKALGVSVLWLVYGKPAQEKTPNAYRNEEIKPALTAQELTAPVISFDRRKSEHPATTEILTLLGSMDDLGKGMALLSVRQIADERRESSKANPEKSSK